MDMIRMVNNRILDRLIAMHHQKMVDATTPELREFHGKAWDKCVDEAIRRAVERGWDPHTNRIIA